MTALQQQVKIDNDKKVSTDLKQLFEKRAHLTQNPC